MLVTMNRQMFESLDHPELVQACILPTIEQLKQERSKLLSRVEGVSGESAVYEQLTTGQQPLFLFWVVYAHLRKERVAEFYWWVAYFLAQPKLWSAVLDGLRFFEDENMLRLFEEMERVYKSKNRLELGVDVSEKDLEDDSELLASVQELHEKFHATTPATIERIGRYIQSNADDFLLIEE